MKVFKQFKSPFISFKLHLIVFFSKLIDEMWFKALCVRYTESYELRSHRCATSAGTFCCFVGEIKQFVNEYFLSV